MRYYTFFTHHEWSGQRYLSSWWSTCLCSWCPGPESLPSGETADECSSGFLWIFYENKVLSIPMTKRYTHFFQSFRHTRPRLDLRDRFDLDIVSYWFKANTRIHLFIVSNSSLYPFFHRASSITFSLTKNNR